MPLSKFTIRDLLAATLSIALVIGGLFGFYRMGMIDPDSAIAMVYTNDEMKSHSIRWKEIAWGSNDGSRRSVSCTTPALNIGNPGGKSHNDELVTLQYENKFGKKCYDVKLITKYAMKDKDGGATEFSAI